VTYDEALLPDGRPRQSSAAALTAIAGKDPERLKAAVRGRLEDAGVLFRSEGGGTAFPLDPVPRVLTAEEWHDVKVGLAQRVKALNAFVADAYGARSIVKAGIVPARVIESAEHYEPAMQGFEPPGGQWIGVAGLDVVRAADGKFRVLEDNLMTPSGFSYAVAAREAVLPELELAAGDLPRAFGELPALLAGALDAVSPGGSAAVVLTDGPENGAHWEHAWVASTLGIPLVEPGDLRVEGDLLLHEEQRVDVVYRRTNADVLDTPVGALLAGPVQAGTVGLVNAFGTGVGDDKLTHAYAEDIVRYYLGEEPAIRSVPTYDFARPDHLEQALDRFDELVVKPRSGSGGKGVMVCPHAERADVDALREEVRRSPRDWVAQPLVHLSTHPTLVGRDLSPRHVDLRPFVFMHGADHPRVLPGGLTRFAVDEGALVVNSTQDGGFKDTWVLA
jgi:carboxylate-amine ligase